MPRALVNGVHLYYEEMGHGAPLLFVHESAGDYASWHLQMRLFARWYRCIAFSARGFLPSDVPEDLAAYSQEHAVEDIRGMLDHLQIVRAHVCGLSMGAYSVLLFGLAYPGRALSLTVAGCGHGSGNADQFRAGIEEELSIIRSGGMAAFADSLARDPIRTTFREKDPTGWQEFRDRLAGQSARGHALTLQGIQLRRPSVLDLGARLERLEMPTLILVGDQDDPCLEPAVFLKRRIPRASLVVIAGSGHTINLEEPDAFNRSVREFLLSVGPRPSCTGT